MFMLVANSDVINMLIMTEIAVGLHVKENLLEVVINEYANSYADSVIEIGLVDKNRRVTLIG